MRKGLVMFVVALVVGGTLPSYASNPPNTARTSQSSGSLEGCLKGKVIRKVKPIYPKVARRNGWEGEVTVRVVLNSNGTIKYLKVIKSSGYPVLDSASVSAIRQWKFAPNVPDGCSGKVTFGFFLH